MGLISMAMNTLGSVGNTVKDVFYCEALSVDVLAERGRKKGRTGADNVITDGSRIAVADGQCLLIVEQGKVVDLCAEPGEYVYDMGTAPSFFCGDLGQGIKNVWEQMKEQFTFGGEISRDQRVYYINTREIVGNKYGTPSPIPFRVVDQRAGVDIDIGLRCFGEYSYRITNPLLFYTNVCGNVKSAYKRSELENQLRTELLTALQPAFERISAQGVRYSSIPGHTMELARELNDILSEKWGEVRGIEIVELGMSSVKASEEDEKMIKEMQRTAAYADPTLAAAYTITAQGEAMKAAAANAGGAVNGFMGLNMAGGAGGVDVNSLFQMGAQKKEAAAPKAGAWKCPQCGSEATGKFCPECGTKKPEEKKGWSCSQCGTVNQGKFCTECGAKKPAGELQYRCDKCGWMPEDPAEPPRFCPECGDPFGDEDKA